MNFLLTAINAKYIHSNPAVYSLRSYAGAPENLSIAEYTINHQPFEIVADIYKRRPDVIAISCYIWNRSMIGELLRPLHKILPDVPVWLGGPEVSYDSEQFLEEFPEVSGIMRGEGEETFRELFEYYFQKKSRLAGIKGLTYRDRDGSIVSTADRELLDINSLPFIYDQYDQSDQSDQLARFENRIIYYESSRGCPYRCSYCLSAIDKRVRLKDLALVKPELDFLLERRVPQVKFVDRTFNCNHKHTMGIWQYIREKDNGITNFHFEIAADIITEEELALLASLRPGLIQLEIGVQSIHVPTLESINRPMQFERIRQTVERLKDGQNIHIHLDLIAGLPYEDYNRFIRSFNAVYACRPEQLQLGFLKVLRGSPLYDKASEYGIVYGDKPPYEVLFTKWLTFDQVLRLKQIEEMVELYYNSNQFVHTLQALEQAFRDPFELFEKLAAFYEEKACFANSPARVYRYQVLLDFACAYDQNNEACYRELLTFDLYLRENVKSRPAYSTDLQPFKDLIWEFYRKEEMERRDLPGYRDFNARQMMKMTHMEVFFYPVWAKRGADKMKKSEEAMYCLFDYQERNPLTKEALYRTMEEVSDRRLKQVLELLDEQYGTDYRCFLHHENAWQLLIATMLSAQCTDARVNIVTKELFQKYACIEDFAEADLKELEQFIYTTGFYHNKAKNIIACCRDIRDRFGGEVPRSLEDLTSLAGVGRKTANVVRGNIFHDPSIVVDTHVKRISRKLGFTREEDPVKIEMELMKILPRDHWILYNIQIITFGREICKAPTPKCDICFLREYCPDYKSRNLAEK